ncbi:hypothetical protein C8035_v008589 [Colletotrichum spinosum]|uniref:Uncharacterized protein n=1 Tax=Colletotrichum spinosum TaxID=1347390 RepID=A0A4R8PQ83_9PEZI|nr:hypothetical protein C8035_v008589 [Colletotrichum spinosum]
MLLKLLLLLPIAALVVEALSPFPPDSAIRQLNYEIFVPEWEVKACPDGESMILRGTVEDVLMELRQINPNFDRDFGIDPNGAPDFSDFTPKPASGNVTIRGNNIFDNGGGKVYCGQRDNSGCYKKEIAKGAYRLHFVPGTPYNGVGKYACGRVSCSFNSAIWWCNDDNKPKKLSTFGHIADGADRVLSSCASSSNQFVIGQARHKDKWRVLIEFSKC